MIARGKTNGQIADELGIGFETVKMHVSRLLAELDVSTREEAAQWWHESRRLRTRMRGLLGLSLGLKTAGGAIGVATASGAVLLGVAALQTAPGDDEPLMAVHVTATPTVIEEELVAVATPTPVQEPAIRLVSFYADTLLTEVHVEFGGYMGFTSRAVFFLTEPNGTQTRLRSEESEAGWHRLVGPPVSPEVGEMVLEAFPGHRDLASTPPPGPPLATFTIPFDGYTGTVVSVTPEERMVQVGDVTVVLDEVLASERRTEVRFHLEGPGAGPLNLIDAWDSLILWSGTPVRTHESLVRSNAERPAWGYIQFDAASGEAVLTMRFGELPRPSPNDGGASLQWSDVEPVVVAEFRFTLP